VLAVLLSVFGGAPAQATPIVEATVTAVGALFHYDYSITFNPSDEEIALLTINLLPGDVVLESTLVAPALFMASYDIGLGLLTLLPVLSFPSAGTVSGFAFDSPHEEGATMFETLGIFGLNDGGDTTGPVGGVAVPEPATSVLLAIGLGALRVRGAVRKRSRTQR
jgi:hypothetical protein